MYEGVWKNELGSELHIEKVGLDGTFVGVYLTNVGDDKVKNVQIPLIGRIQGDLISFIVDFGIDGKSKSMAAWVGRHELVSDERAATERRVIKTIWTLARLETGPADAKEPTEPWETFLTNGNIFVWHGKIPPKASS